MGHPHDPESHSHHNSVWISHHDVNGTNFWTDHGGGKIRHKRIVKLEDSGGRIRNSEGAVNEKEVYWKRARWVDYSGAVTNENLEGITLFDHLDNPNFPTYFHVRNDGWMGTSLTFDGPRKIQSNEPLHLRYGLYVHSDMEPKEALEIKWKQFTKNRPQNK